jgi:hypothetical protein
LSPKRPREGFGYFGFVDGRGIDFTKSTGGWLNEPNPRNDKEDWQLEDGCDWVSEFTLFH